MSYVLRFLLVAFACFSAELTPQHIKRVVDGDTFALYAVDGLTNEARVRVLGVDAWERSDPRGAAATAFTTEWLARGPFTITACKHDSFGRLLAWVYRGADSLHVALIAGGHGVRAP